MDVDTATWSEEAAFRRNSPILWTATLAGPFLLTLSLIALVAYRSGLETAWKLTTTAVVTFFLLGKFVILGGADNSATDQPAFFTGEQLFFMVLYMDVMTSCLLAFHVGFLLRLPYLGPRMKVLIEDGSFILKSNPWMKRATFLGLVTFVMVPLAATGSVGGSIFGRLLGMSRSATFTGILIGNLLGCALMYFGGELITKYLGRDNPALLVGGILVIGGCLFLLNRRYQSLKKRSTTAS